MDTSNSIMCIVSPIHKTDTRLRRMYYIPLKCSIVRLRFTKNIMNKGVKNYLFSLTNQRF